MRKDIKNAIKYISAHNNRIFMTTLKTKKLIYKLKRFIRIAFNNWRQGGILK